MDYDGLAASAGVEWNEGDRYTRGHLATVMAPDGALFNYPCTCVVGVNHGVLAPTQNPAAPDHRVIPDPPVGRPDAPDEDPAADHRQNDDPHPTHGRGA